MILDRFDHHRVLHRRRGHLHAPRAADRGMRDVAIAADLIGRVDDHDPLAQIVGQDARGFAQQGGFAHARAAHHQDAAARLDDVADYGHCPKDSPC